MSDFMKVTHFFVKIDVVALHISLRLILS